MANILKGASQELLEQVGSIVAERNAALAELAALRQQLGAERARLADVERMADERIAALSQQRDALRVTLEAVEWVWHEDKIHFTCPSCHVIRNERWQHFPNCDLEAALALVRE